MRCHQRSHSHMASTLRFESYKVSLSLESCCSEGTTRISHTQLSACIANTIYAGSVPERSQMTEPQVKATTRKQLHAKQAVKSAFSSPSILANNLHSQPQALCTALHMVKPCQTCQAHGACGVKNHKAGSLT